MSGKMLDPHMWTLESLFKNIYNIPVYQRPYSWGKEQIDTLINDIFGTYYSGAKNDGYYTGNIIVFDKKNKANGIVVKYDIIDGQQRIATFSLMILALYSLAQIKGADKANRVLMKIEEALWKTDNGELNRQLKTVSLNSIEKDCFASLYDYCFDNSKSVIDFCKKYPCKSVFDRTIIENFINIYNSLDNKIADTAYIGVLNFADYLLNYIQFIVTEANCKENKVFSMFESINSKGKKLEEIDLIKTYIFSKLDESSYETYLKKWGSLIIETRDNLYDYLYTYIRAYLRYYRQNINVSNFKDVSSKELISFFNVTNESEALKKLLDDLSDKVNFYNMLSSVDDANTLVKSTKFKFYFKVFTDISYKHPKPLFFRAIVEHHKGILNKNDFVEIISQTTSFMMKFLTISGKDSKDAINLFKGIMENIYDNGSIEKEYIINQVAAEFLKQGISKEKLKSELGMMDAFEKNRRLTIALLALYESTEQQDSGKVSISYDQAYTILNSFSGAFSLDHLLVQKPEKSSAEFKYYCDESTYRLKLKDGHDFPNNIVVDGMDYEIFTSSVLNKIGNLRIYYKDKNSGRQNNAISLRDYSNFTTYNDIKERESKLTNLLIDNCLPSPNINVSQIQTNNRKKPNTDLPKMDQLIKAGMINIGDPLLITVKPDGSEAKLLDSKYVDYNGQKMTLNEWGCLVTGWTSIRIYSYVAIVGEDETLQEKRERLFRVTKRTN